MALLISTISKCDNESTHCKCYNTYDLQALYFCSVCCVFCKCERNTV